MKIMDLFNLNRNFKREKVWFTPLYGYKRIEYSYPAVIIDRKPIIGTKIIYRDHYKNVCVEWVSRSSLFPRD